MILAKKSIIAAISGGILLGTIVMTKFKYNGNTLGISGIVGGITQDHITNDNVIDRLYFLFGIFFSGLIMRFLIKNEYIEKLPYTILPEYAGYKLFKILFSGLLVGFGTGLAHGCTSGHGIFGNSRLSLRSMTSTLTFMLSSFLTFNLCNYYNLTCHISSSNKDLYKLSPSKEEEEKEKLKQIEMKKQKNSLSSNHMMLLTLFLILLYELLLFGIYHFYAIPSSSSNLIFCLRLSDFIHGLFFGFGLNICGMSSPKNVLSFFNISENFKYWDPSLMMVMVGAISVARLLYMFNGGEAYQLHPPLFRDNYTICSYESTQHIDDQLILGSIIFGIGWSMMGYCPGPALLSLTLRTRSFNEILTNLLYNIAMFGGWALHYRVALKWF